MVPCGGQEGKFMGWILQQSYEKHAHKFVATLHFIHYPHPKVSHNVIPEIDDPGVWNTDQIGKSQSDGPKLHINETISNGPLSKNADAKENTEKHTKLSDITNNGR